MAVPERPESPDFLLICLRLRRDPNMRSATAACVFALVAQASAQALSAGAVTAALQAQGLTRFASFLSGANGTSVLSAIAASGAGTVFAPSDGALVNTTSLSAGQIAYHVARRVDTLSSPCSDASTVALSRHQR